MGAFGGLILTNKGRALQAKAQTGVQLNFTKVKVGDGSLSGQSILELNDLISPKKELSILELKTMPEGKASLRSFLSNADITTGFYWRELGVFAQDPDEGEILYCYGNAGENVEYIPAGGGADVVEKYINIVTLVGNASNVSATLGSEIYVTQADFDAHKNNSSAHHTKTGHNEVYGLVQYDTEANMPAAGIQGRWFITSDTKAVYYDNGTSWVLVGVLGGQSLPAHLAETTLHRGANYVQNTEPSDKTQGKTWFNPGTEILYVADGSRYIPIPPVQVLQEVIDFTEAGVIVQHSSTMIENGSIVLYAGSIATASYTNKSFSVQTEDSNPLDIVFNIDGSKMFMLGASNTVYEYTLTTPFDISTANYANKSFYVGTEAAYAYAIVFNSDGSKMFMTASSTVYEYTLTTPFDISTASYTGKSFSVGTEDSYPRDIVFNSDGSKMFILGGSNDTVYEYTLTTPFDISTASYTGKSFYVGTEDANPQDIVFNSDGSKMFMIGDSNNSVYEYDLTTPFDISTASYTGKSLYVGGQETYPRGMALNNDDSKMFIIGDGADKVCEYDLDFSVASSGFATIELPQPSDNIKAWDLVTYQVTPDGETVTVDIETSSDGGNTWVTEFANIPQNFDISTIDPTYHVRFKANLSRASTANNPTCDYLARRFVR